MQRHYGDMIAWTNIGSVTQCLGCGTDKILGITQGSCPVTNSKIVSANELKSMASFLGTEFAQDTTGINDGFPVLTWQLKQK